MRLYSGFLFAFLLSASASFAQPRYSPEIRADRETQWMTDSLHISPEQGKKVHAISLDYNQQLDKAAALPDKQKIKQQQRIENKKDTSLKALLNKEQYKKYYRKEKLARQRDKAHYTGTHQPL